MDEVISTGTAHMWLWTLQQMFYLTNVQLDKNPPAATQTQSISQVQNMSAV